MGPSPFLPHTLPLYGQVGFWTMIIGFALFGLWVWKSRNPGASSRGERIDHFWIGVLGLGGAGALVWLFAVMATVGGSLPHSLL